MMKFLKYAVIAGVVMMFAGCQKMDLNDLAEPTMDVSPANIEGIWMLESWNGEQLPEGRYFYIVLERKDCLFTTYENTASFTKHSETGYYKITEDESTGSKIIRGLYDYSMGTEWNHAYYVSDLTSGSMTWTVTDDPTDVSRYVRVDGLPEFLTK